MAVAAPAFAANAPTTPFEANTNTPYDGANLDGLYAPSASDPIDGDLSASIETFLVSNDQQIFLSGVEAYIFPLGSTQIKNTVTNSLGVSSEELVTIVVVDTTPPVFDPALANINVAATSAAGAVVTYVPTATNNGGPVTVTCAPTSGSQFAIGTTLVTCTAGVTTGTFNVSAGRLLGLENCTQLAGTNSTLAAPAQLLFNPLQLPPSW